MKYPTVTQLLAASGVGATTGEIEQALDCMTPSERTTAYDMADAYATRTTETARMEPWMHLYNLFHHHHVELMRRTP